MAAFEKKYGVKVRLWRGGSEEILQRTVTEARGGRFDVDVVETAAPQIVALDREKLLQEVQTPVGADIMREAIIPGQPLAAVAPDRFHRRLQHQSDQESRSAEAL